MSKTELHQQWYSTLQQTNITHREEKKRKKKHYKCMNEPYRKHYDIRLYACFDLKCKSVHKWFSLVPHAMQWMKKPKYNL